LADFFLSQAELVDEESKTFRLFQGAESLSLYVLDEGKDEEGAVVHVPHDGRNFAPPQVRNRAQAPVPGNELVSLPFCPRRRPDQDRLQEPIDLDRPTKVGQLFFLEVPSRLERVGKDLAEWKGADLPLSGSFGKILLAEEGLETSAEAGSLGSRHLAAPFRSRLRVPRPWAFRISLATDR
jgi:hypothetical protein